MKTLSKFFAIGLVISLFSACGTSRRKNPATHDEGVVIRGVRWATRNVDMPGTFAQNPEDFGMFFQWNRKKGWNVVGEVEGWDSSIPTGTAWYAENDPCPPGWRVPTLDELQSLRIAGSRWATKNNVNGRFFGDEENFIFLPAVGWRYGGNDSIHVSGYSGGYWSNSNQHSGSGRARFMAFFSFDTLMPDTPRNNGRNIRCVAK